MSLAFKSSGRESWTQFYEQNVIITRSYDVVILEDKTQALAAIQVCSGRRWWSLPGVRGLVSKCPTAESLAVITAEPEGDRGGWYEMFKPKCAESVIDLPASSTVEEERKKKTIKSSAESG